MAKLKESTQLAAAASETAQKLNIISQAVEAETSKTTQSKEDENKKIMVTFYLSKAKKKEYEKLFGAEGINLSLGIRMCLDYAAIQLKNGKLILSDSGIHENVLNNLK